MTFRCCSGHLFEHPLEQFGCNYLPFFFFLAISSLWTPNRWSTTPVITLPMFGWLETPLGCVASLGFHRARVWMGKGVARTTESNHEQRTSFWIGTPSLKVAGCSVDLVVVIARCRVVMCILQWHSGGYKWPTLNGRPVTGLPPVIR